MLNRAGPFLWLESLALHRPFNTQLSAPDYGSFFSLWLSLPSLNRSFPWIMSSHSVIMQFIKWTGRAQLLPTWYPLCSDLGGFIFHSVKTWVTTVHWIFVSCQFISTFNKSQREQKDGKSSNSLVSSFLAYLVWRGI